MASEIEATPEWVEAHMGQENDIFLIRQNLSRQKAISTE